jgi:hypothetical protein
MFFTPTPDNYSSGVVFFISVRQILFPALTHTNLEPGTSSYSRGLYQALEGIIKIMRKKVIHVANMGKNFPVAKFVGQFYMAHS